jgi:ribosomal peptide maturation radical SAM protein 1
MYKISLIDMPFASLSQPSLALTQLKAVVERRCGADVRIRILYLNQEVARYLGFELYDYVIGAPQANNSGLGDWIFRQVAFPDQEDNTASYMQRYFPHLDADAAAIKGAMLAKRAGLKRHCEGLVTRHQLDSEQLVGFTSMFAQNVACCALARIIKARNPRVVTVMGGANCEAPMGQELVRHMTPIDLVFSGPALVSFADFVQCELAGDRAGGQRIRGVCSREGSGSLPGEAGGGMGRDLPIDVPVPLDYDTFLADLKASFPDGRVRPSLTFETSRGCWWGERSHCTFCGLNGSTMMYRAMPAAQALALFNELFDRYGDRCSRFESIDNIVPRQYLKEVFPHLVPPPGASIFYEVKADLKEREMEVLSRAGVTEIQPGIEALASSTLKLMGKGTTSFQNVAFLKSCLRYGVRPVWNLLIGFPGEDEQVYEKYLRDIPLLTHLPPPSGAFPVRFDRYSPYFTRAREYGLDLAPYEFYNAIYPFAAEALQKIAYYFEDRNYDAVYLARLTAWQDRLAAAVERWAQRWHGKDGLPKAALELRREGDAFIVRDTRHGEAGEHCLGDLALDLMVAARAQGLPPRVLMERVGADEPAVAAELAHLQDLGLLFEENGRFIALVTGLEVWRPGLAGEEARAAAAAPHHEVAVSGGSPAA